MTRGSSPGATSGSSPLARGLRQGGQGPGAGGGIIPARAGFTERRGVHGPLQRDHPRSRGVYALGDAVRASHSGSSPLARGLRNGAVAALIHGGIIPARAGFTLYFTPKIISVRDHPRSRGVYRPSPSLPLRRDGSSPLARGLLSPSPRRGSRHRIIPARAGFTRGGRRAGSWRPGSSPLARGLP